MQTQREGLNFYFEIAMYNKSYIEISWCIILCWHRFINYLCYKSIENAHCFPRWPLSNPNSQQRKSLAPFTHTVFTGNLPLRDHVWKVPFQTSFLQSYRFYEDDVIPMSGFTKLCCFLNSFSALEWYLWTLRLAAFSVRHARDPSFFSIHQGYGSG